VTDDDSRADAVAQAADRLGGIDAVVYCTGLGHHRGGAAAPAPIEGNGRLLHLGQRLAHRAVARARCLQVTKAALDKLVDAWRAEHPDRRRHPAPPALSSMQGSSDISPHLAT